jgi:sulfur-oxidizing protein SoxZ
VPIAGRIQIPAQAKRGEIITIRVLLQHAMENGFRRDAVGTAIPKNVVNRIVCRYSGVEVFRADLDSGIAANPYLQFTTRAIESGTIDLEWVDDVGERGSHSARLEVI